MRRVALGWLIALGCGSPPAPPVSNRPSAEVQWPVVREACPCEERGRAPEKLAPDVEARWRRAVAAIEPVYAELGALFGQHMCKTSNADLQAVLDRHGAALREVAALDAASCDRFSAWLHNGACACKGILEVVQGLRACSKFPSPMWERISKMVLWPFPCASKNEK